MTLPEILALMYMENGLLVAYFYLVGARTSKNPISWPVFAGLVLLWPISVWKAGSKKEESEDDQEENTQ